MSKVVFVAGASRSGSTLLGEALGAQPGVLNGGELALFWRDAARGNTCACGSTLTSCDLWGTALDRLARDAGIRREDYQRLARTRAQLARTTRPRKLARMRRSPDRWTADERHLVHATQSLYAFALELADADVLIDTSKTLPAMLFHDLSPQHVVTVVHLVRDPRAVVASTVRSRGVERGNPDSLPPGAGPSIAIARWWWSNVMAGIGSRRATDKLLVRYESFVSEPEAQTRAICGSLGIDFDPTTIEDRHLRVHSPSHAAVGNPRRGTEITPILPDERWKQDLSPARQRLVQATTWPLDKTLRVMSARQS